MRIKPGDNPDVWFETGDLSKGSIVAIWRESVTCCGFLGGDRILVISSGHACADLLKEYRSVLPWIQRKNTSNPHPGLESRRARVLSALQNLDIPGDAEPSANISAWQDLFSHISDTIWFGGSSDPFRFSLEVIGDIQTFLAGPVYPDRLISSLHWWYQNEATKEERGKFLVIPLIDHLLYPEHDDYIIRSINLYNHGTYEVSKM
jgi:hypothetical protein